MKKISIRYTLIFSLILSTVFSSIAFSVLQKKLSVQEETTYNASSIIEKIAFIQELSLVKYHYTSVIGLKSNKKFQEIDLPFTGKSFLASYDGFIEAGVDLEKASIEISQQNIRLVLPKPILTEHSIDEKSLVVYDESKNILNPIKIEDYNEALKREKQVMEEKAIANGILKQSEEQATLLLKNFLSELGFEDISIEFRSY